MSFEKSFLRKTAGGVFYCVTGCVLLAFGKATKQETMEFLRYGGKRLRNAFSFTSPLRFDP